LALRIAAQLPSQASICPAKGAAADRIERDGGAGGRQRIGQLGQEVRRTAVHHPLRADALEQRGLLGLAHDVDQPDAVLLADAVDQHLAQVGGGGGVHQRGMAFAGASSRSMPRAVSGLTKQEAP
jgi:hypothetical protein